MGMEEGSVVHLREMSDTFDFLRGEWALELTAGDGCEDVRKPLGTSFYSPQRLLTFGPSHQETEIVF